MRGVSRVDETKRAWDEVGEGFVKLGRMIAERHRRLGEERVDDPTTHDDGAVADAVRRATDELDRAFTSLGDTLRDDEAQKHLRDTGHKLGDALKVTFKEMRRAVGSNGEGEKDVGSAQP
jgi:hypothetical protein